MKFINILSVVLTFVLISAIESQKLSPKEMSAGSLDEEMLVRKVMEIPKRTFVMFDEPKAIPSRSKNLVYCEIIIWIFFPYFPYHYVLIIRTLFARTLTESLRELDGIKRCVSIRANSCKSDRACYQGLASSCRAGLRRFSTSNVKFSK